MLHHLRVERGGDGGGLQAGTGGLANNLDGILGFSRRRTNLSAVREVILQATLDHVVVVQPAVGSHHARLLIVQNLERNYRA